MVPSSATSAAVPRLPIMPCSPMARSGSGFGAPRSAIITELRIERHATVDKQRRPGHIVGLIRGEPDRRACHVLRLAYAPVGDQLQQLLHCLLRFPGLPIDRGSNSTWSHSIDADGVRGDLLGKGPHHHPNAALGRRVVEMPGPGNQLVNRAHANDVARRPRRSVGLSLLAKQPYRLTAAKKLTGEVDVDDGAPVVERHVRDRGVLLQAGVRDQHIHAAEGRDGLFE